MEPGERRIPPVRQIIDGHVYDTVTASLQWQWDSCDDPEWERGGCVLGLFLSVHGRYFSYYCGEEDDFRVFLTPLTEREAIEWMQRECPYEIEQVFGKLFEAGEGPAYTPKYPEL
jgi:hypothetical protein